MYGGVEKNKYNEYFKNKNYAIAYKIKECIKYGVSVELKEYNINNAPRSYIYIK